jgi:hypothetical protein
VEQRILLSVVNVTAAGGEGALRSAISADDANAQASNTINIGAGTLALSELSPGNLLIENENIAKAPDKTLIIDGAGRGFTIIEPSTSITWVSRILQIVGPSVTVELENLTIKGGRAHDGGAVGGTMALGGGILIDGGNVTLSNVNVTQNRAIGASGAAGANGNVAHPNGTNGGSGDGAEGGGIYLASGSLLIKNKSQVFSNDLNAGAGGNGGAGVFGGTTAANGDPGAAGAVGNNGATGGFSAKAPNGAPGAQGATGDDGDDAAGQAGKGGDGGSGGAASGGGIFVAGGQLTIRNSFVSDNPISGGNGGTGGAGAGASASYTRLRGGQGGTGGDGGMGGAGGPGAAGRTTDAGGHFAILGYAGSGGNGGAGGMGANGGAGGNGADGGDAGKGGDGGDASGGGIYIAQGTVAIRTSNVVGNSLFPGHAGRGGRGGRGGSGQFAGLAGDGGRGGLGGGGGGIPGVGRGGNAGVGGNGGEGVDGGDGGDGADAGDGGTGGNASGGGILVAAGSLTLSGNTISENMATGGAGGAGGSGGKGGAGAAGGGGGGGGQGGSAGQGGEGTTSMHVHGTGGLGGNGGNGDNGANGGQGGNAGKGGGGGAGGNAKGGGVAVLGGTVNSAGDTFSANQAKGGGGAPGGPGGVALRGGTGGPGGPGGRGGDGGIGGGGATRGAAGGAGGNGGNGGNGGDGGDRGSGGAGGTGGGGGVAMGGSIYVSAGQLAFSGATNYSGTVIGGNGGNAGAGGSAGGGGPGVASASGGAGSAGGAGLGMLGAHGGAVGNHVFGATGATGRNGNPGAAGNAGNPGTTGAAGGIGLLGASSGSGISGSFSSASSDTLVFSTQPANGKAGKTLAPVVVQIKGAGNTVLTSDTSAVTVAIQTGPTGAALLGTVTVNAVAGVATFNTLSIDTTGTYTLTAGDTADSAPAGIYNSTNFIIAPKAANKLIFIQKPTNTTAGATIFPGVTVQITDKFGNAVANDTSIVTLAVATGPAGGVLGGIVAQPANNGLATFSNLSIDKAGGYTLAAADGTITPALSGPFTIAPAAASKLKFTTQPPFNTTAGTTLAPFVVKVKDAFGNKVPDNTSTLTLSIASGPSGAALSGTTSVIFANGVATFSGVSLTKAGSYTLTATDGALTATSASFAINAAAPANLSFLQPPTNAKAGHLISPAITVGVTDAFGNPVSGKQITLEIVTAPTDSVIGVPFQAVAHQGVATFSTVSFTRAGSYTLEAVHGTLTSAPSAGFTIKHVAASQLAFVQQPTTATTASPIAPLITVDVEDKFGNLVTNNDSDVTLSLQRSPAGAVLGGTFTAAAAAGEATFSDVLLDDAGTYELAAIDAPLTGATSAKFTVDAV